MKKRLVQAEHFETNYCSQSNANNQNNDRGSIGLRLLYADFKIEQEVADTSTEVVQETPDQTEANQFYQDVASNRLEFLIAQFRS